MRHQFSITSVSFSQPSAYDRLDVVPRNLAVGKWTRDGFPEIVDAQVEILLDAPLARQSDVVGLDNVGGRGINRGFHNILQFANVARKIVTLQLSDGVRRKLFAS